jgi:putative ABC transport system permease protein
VCLSATAEERSITIILGVFAGVGLLLAAIGVYGVMSYTVSQRTHEIGIRVALGAGAGDVIRLVLAKGLRLSIAGVVMGAGGSFALTRLIRSQLFGVTPTDPGVFGIVALFLVLVGLAACYVPARRAARITPLVALRNE